MRQLRIIGIFLITLTVYSCDSRRNHNNFNGTRFSESSRDFSSPGFNHNRLNNFKNSIERKILQEGSLSFKTKDLNKTRVLITQTVNRLNGFILKDEVFDYNEREEHRIVIQVPSDKFDLLLTKISQSALKIDYRNISRRDVTSEYIDMDTRLKTKKELEIRYIDLLKQAKKVEEILAIEKEMGYLRAEIESIEGRLNYFKDKVSMSSLTVTYYKKAPSGLGFNFEFKDGIKRGLDNLLWFFIWLIQVWPFVIITFITLFFVIRQIKRRRKKNAA
jgi:hypothetical protein